MSSGEMELKYCTYCKYIFSDFIFFEGYICFYLFSD